MSFLLGAEKISYEVASKVVFEDVSLGVDTGERIGIVGRNGDGKSTLLRLLDGQIEPDSGRIIKTRGTTIGFLGQADHLQAEDSVGHAIVGDLPEYMWASNPKIRDVITGLLSDVSWEASIETLSGGQRRRVDLARVLIEDVDILMLDEPTNHLDIKAITWLANHLKTRWKKGAGALLVVTHDRWFLDEVCNTMWEVFGASVLPFEGGFSAYIMQRVERERLAALAEEKRQNALRRELAWLSRGARARATKPKFHVQAAQALIDDVPELRNEIELKRMAMARIGKQVVDIENATVDFDGNIVLDDVTWLIGPGDRAGIVGGNGVGKTTLLRLLTGELNPTSGRVKIGQTVQFAVLSQHLNSLDEFGDERVRDAISRFSRRVMLDGKEMTPAQLLERLGFEKADLNEPVSSLSGGQKRRLALMMILLEEPNVLVLDEPGNDLDVDMLAALEDLLDGWPGTLILVTHDRYLMERVTDNQFALIDGKFTHLPGGIDEYLQIMSSAERATNEIVDTQNGAKKIDSQNKSKDLESEEKKAQTGNTLSNKELQTYKKQLASFERKIETALKKVEAAQAKMQEVDPCDSIALMEAQSEIDSSNLRLQELEEGWFEIAEILGV